MYPCTKSHSVLHEGQLIILDVDVRKIGVLGTNAQPVGSKKEIQYAEESIMVG